MNEEEIRKVVRYLAGECAFSEAEEMKSWIREHPNEFREIESIYRFTPFETGKFEDVDVRQLLGKRRINRSFKPGVLLKIAASIIVLMVLGLSAHYALSTKHTISNNQTVRVAFDLPDGSKVILDKGAKLNYRTSFMGTFNRQVELDGRGYFIIARNEKNPFTIQTTNAEIRVLGTRFSATGDKNKTQVVLEEGKVRVTSKSNDKPIDLVQPGEQVIISRDGLTKHNIVNNQLYLSWLTDKLEFDDCSVEEALEFLADTWNIHVVLNDTNSLKTKLYGSAPSDDPALIIRAIALITNQEVTVNNRQTSDE